MNNAESNISTQNAKHEYWLTQIKQWEDSKLSQRVFCLQAGINYTTFIYWKSALKSKPSDNPKRNFASVKVISTNQSNAETPKAIQIKLVTGHVVYIPTTLAIKEIADLIYLIGNANA